MSAPDTHETSAPDPAQRPNVRIRLLIVVVLTACVGLIWYVKQPAPLTAAESQAVGTWTFPMPPNPPANALRQIYELRADRTIITYHQSVSTGVKTIQGTGKWRIEGDSLVWEIGSADYQVWMRAIADGRSLRYESRMPYYGVNGDSLFLKGKGSSKVEMRRVTTNP